MKTAVQLIEGFGEWLASEVSLVSMRSDELVVAEYMRSRTQQAVIERVLRHREEMFDAVSAARQSYVRPNVNDATRDAYADKLPEKYRMLFSGAWENEGTEFPRGTLRAVKPPKGVFSMNEYRAQFGESDVGMIAPMPNDACIFLSPAHTGVTSETLQAMKLTGSHPNQTRVRLFALLSRERPAHIAADTVRNQLGLAASSYTSEVYKAVDGLNKIGKKGPEFVVQKTQTKALRMLTLTEIPLDLLKLIHIEKLSGDETDLAIYLLSHLGSTMRPEEMMVAAGVEHNNKSQKAMDTVLEKLRPIFRRMGVLMDRSTEGTCTLRLHEDAELCGWMEQLQKYREKDVQKVSVLGLQLQSSGLSFDEYHAYLSRVFAKHLRAFPAERLHMFLSDDKACTGNNLELMKSLLLAAVDEKSRGIVQRSAQKNGAEKSDQEITCSDEFEEALDASDLTSSQLAGIYCVHHNAEISEGALNEFLDRKRTLPTSVVANLRRSIETICMRNAKELEKAQRAAQTSEQP